METPTEKQQKERLHYWLICQAVSRRELTRAYRLISEAPTEWEYKEEIPKILRTLEKLK